MAHNIGPMFLRAYGRMKPLQTLTWSPFAWRDLEFTNPLGIAGGVDKNGDCIDGWWALGAGFI
ncbi:MAG: quinone-dependent dihydroorotate dehydrogenase, partial [Bdellovibrionales bacterium]|nr:quinone-dependent dihydroorotate dehydrogenase [Bdellovibrionales bacterium]